MEIETAPKIRWVKRTINGQTGEWKYVLQYLVETRDLSREAGPPDRAEWQDVPVIDPEKPGFYEYPYGGPYHARQRNPAVERLQETEPVWTYTVVDLDNALSRLTTNALTPTDRQVILDGIKRTDEKLRDRIHELEVVPASEAVKKAAAYKERAEVAEKSLASYLNSLTRLRAAAITAGCEVDDTPGTVVLRNKRAEVAERAFTKKQEGLEAAQRTIEEERKRSYDLQVRVGDIVKLVNKWPRA